MQGSEHHVAVRHVGEAEPRFADGDVRMARIPWPRNRNLLEKHRRPAIIEKLKP